MANFKTQSTSHAHVGFGMLRIDPSDRKHLAAIRAALLEGVYTFDLGDLAPPAALKARAIFNEVTELEKTTSGFAPSLHFLIRGNLGDGSKLETFFSAIPQSPRVEWTYFIQGSVGTSYEGFWSELAAIEKQAPDLKIGVSSARFTYPKEDPEFLSLEGLLATVDSDIESDQKMLSRNFGFTAIEFPLNLYESAAYQLDNQTLGNRTVSLFEAAAAYGIETYSRRPLDALTDTQLLRLVSYPDHHRLDLDLALTRTLEVALTAEKALEGTDLPQWAHRLQGQLKYVNDPEQWKEILKRRIKPDLSRVSESNIQGISNYLECMDAVLLAVQLWCEKRAAERNERIRSKIASSSSELRSLPRNLAECAFHLYRAMSPTNIVLLGMRSEAYVASALKAFYDEQKHFSREAVLLALDAAHTAIHEETHHE